MSKVYLRKLKHAKNDVVDIYAESDDDEYYEESKS
jgi:hypothetical protein